MTDQHQPGQTSKWEWVAAAISTIIVLGAIGYLAVEVARGGDSAPSIVVQVDAISPTGSGYVVEFTARNDGSTTAARVHVSGTIADGETPVESSQTVIDYVPAGASRQAGLFFTRDPRLGDLQLRPTGYDQP